MSEFLEQFAGREAGPLVQFIKYAICGGVATGTHIVVFYLFAIMLFPAIGAGDQVVGVLRRFGIGVSHPAEAVRARNAVLDNVIAFFFSNTVAYLLNIMWVFEPGRHGRLVEIGVFFAVSATSMAIGTWLLRLLIRRFGFTTTLAFVANIVTSLAINFVMRKFVVFKG